ncbi:MAG: hypothetical protein OIN66_15580, partial [Candidatus Methanoperedens sp.]|nr:hypothetical protein [Candidatus Methanoperedens sp.]
MVKYNIVLLLVFVSFILTLSTQPVFAAGEFRFDFATKVAGADNYTKHWSNTYPPDPRANIIIYSYAGNMSFNRLSAVGFMYVVYDPLNNIVAVEKMSSFQRSYDPNVVYYTLHPRPDWIEGTYKVKIVVFDQIDRDAWEDIKNDPYGIISDPEKYKTFYETGSNAKDLGVLKDLGDPVAQAVLNFQINKSVSIYPPDRFLLHDVRFIDNTTERILGEKLKIEVQVDNNYLDDGTFKLAMLVDNSIVATQDVTVSGLNTSRVIFDAKAGKKGTFKLHFGTDTSDVKYRNAEITFSIKNESETSRLDLPKIEITGMNVNKEFAAIGSNVTVSVTLINNGKAGSKNITVYSNRVPIGSAGLSLQYLEERTVEIPIILNNMGINKITVSDAPQLFRNVFVQESEGAPAAQENPIVKRLKENPL